VKIRTLHGLHQKQSDEYAKIIPKLEYSIDHVLQRVEAAAIDDIQQLSSLEWFLFNP
jgi:hypothetical protein